MQHARQRHKQAAKQTARQLRWDPGKQTQALSHTAVTKAAGLGQGPTGLVLAWMLGAGSLVLGDGVGGEGGGRDAACRFKGASDPIG